MILVGNNHTISVFQIRFVIINMINLHPFGVSEKDLYFCFQYHLNRGGCSSSNIVAQCISDNKHTIRPSGREITNEPHQFQKLGGVGGVERQINRKTARALQQKSDEIFVFDIQNVKLYEESEKHTFRAFRAGDRKV